MNLTLSVLLAISFACILYAYGGYPILMSLLARMRANPWNSDPGLKLKVSVIVAGFNEELVLKNCLTALTESDYPPSLIEILVGSDGSTDETNAIIQDFANLHANVRGFYFESRRGKIPVVNDLVRAASGDLLIFTDADVTFDPSTISHHVRHYADETVGGVAGNLTLVTNETKMGPVDSEHAYMSIENKLRRNEALMDSTIGIFGGNYSIRCELWKELPDAPVCDELLIAGYVIQAGRRVVFDPTAVAQEYFSRSWLDEFRRKSRFAARGLMTVREMKVGVMPHATWSSFMLFSHKILRWFAPFLFGAIVLLSLIGSVEVKTGVWSGLFLLEVLLIVCGLLGGLLDTMGLKIPVLDKMWWFLSMNAAFGIGVLKFLFGKEKRFWDQPTRVGIVPTVALTHMTTHAKERT